ncbi:TIGR00375 family protein [Methanobrevibacter curvatus]|uniref:PHP domain protein n=1 Tax=Methanobrevibacter curvatus TaxID=49547 RepID=A0A162FFF8_9EURY|nr:TIGR00375 family protein [Methanobrevibacter curvatus]KZX12315.1 PHP domain protein [Methanobrevibacter curvatus]
MLVNADLHVHSCFSMASSKDMVINNIAPQAKLKGLQLVGTGDGFHNGWLDIIEESTTYSGDGIYSKADCDFILTSEVEGLNRIHHLFILPNIEIAREISKKLISKNINSDGRARVKMSGAELLELGHEYGCLVGPAHAFTPWTGMYKSFDSIYDCYGGLKADFVELGLSADTDMADTIKELKDFPFLTNSDAHSPWPHRIGREFNQIDMDDVSFSSLKKAFEKKTIKANYGLIANLGKYHMTACTKCYKFVDPLLAKEKKMKCECKGTIKKGVDFRIKEIADWDLPHHPDHRPPYIHLMPLAEIISMVYETGVTTKTVQNIWHDLIKKLGNEIEILLKINLDEIAKIDENIKKAIESFRNKGLHIVPGGGGKYGEISLDKPLEEREVLKKEKLVSLDDF